jgi:type I restriction-modification system DNA methylase subunit
MVDAGIVEAIVVLPPRLRTNTSIALAVWLLRSPGALVIATDDVLLVDGSELGASGRSQFSLPESSVDRLAALVARWRDTGELSAGDATIAAVATIDQILAAEGSLDPRRYRAQPHADLSVVRDDAQRLRGSLKESSAAAGAALDDLLAFLDHRP